MKHFSLEQDKRIPYGVLLTQLNNIYGYYESKKGNLTSLDRAIISFVNSSPINFYPDVLDRQIFMIKGVVKEVFDLFLPELEYKHCCLLDNPNRKHELYFIPILSSRSVLADAEKNDYIFRLVNERDSKVIISIEVAEAILRRKPTGIRISSI